MVPGLVVGIGQDMLRSRSAVLAATLAATLAAMLALGTPPSAAARNVIIFVADGLRSHSVTPSSARSPPPTASSRC
jgi:alkaline phosphatase